MSFEWLTDSREDPAVSVDHGALRTALDATSLPGGSRITSPPGGQLELSSAPGADLEVLHGDETDLAAPRAAWRPRSAPTWSGSGLIDPVASTGGPDVLRLQADHLLQVRTTHDRTPERCRRAQLADCRARRKRLHAPQGDRSPLARGSEPPVRFTARSVG